MSFVKTASGIVVGAHPVAADAGLEILKAGGNAIDAAVAAAFTAAVVLPGHNGVGGYGGCLVAYLASEKRVIAIDFNSRAPRAATEVMFPIKVAADGKNYTVPGQIHIFGPLSIGVPGVVAGLTTTLEQFGTVSLSDVLKPAIRAAQDGFLVNTTTSTKIFELSDKLNQEFPETARLLMPDSTPPKPGQYLVFPELSETLSQISTKGPQAFYTGEIGQKMVDYLQSQGGILTETDLAEYKTRIVEPLRISYRGYTIFTPPLCAGGLTTLQMLRVLEHFSIADMKPDVESLQTSPELYHLLIEIMKVCWRERLTRFGDPRFVNVNEQAELKGERVHRLYEEVKKGLEKPTPGEVIAPEPLNCTTHICAADTNGNVVSLTQTHGGLFGSLVSVPGTGLILGHGVGRFDPKPGGPNSIRPGKQPLHNMSPIIILRDGRPFAAVGTPGGRTIVNNQLYFTLNLLDFGLSISDALALPRLHCESAEPAQIEESADQVLIGAVRDRNHQVDVIEGIGGPAHGIVFGTQPGEYDGATDPRGEGKVAFVSGGQEHG